MVLGAVARQRRRHMISDSPAGDGEILRSAIATLPAGGRPAVRECGVDVGTQRYELEEVAEQLPTFSPNLANQVDSSQVLPALARVDEVFQAALALFYLEDYSYQEIADQLGMPVASIGPTRIRSLKKLRKLLS